MSDSRIARISPAAASKGFRLAKGTAMGFGAELLLLPTGLVTAAVLARTLGPREYGVFSLVASFVTWWAWTTTSLLSRAAVKFVSDADDWHPVATSVLRWRLGVGVGSMLILFAGAGSFAEILGSRTLAPYIRVFSLDLLLFNLVRAHREVLIGTGRFREVAVLSAVRWIGRMVFLVTLVIWTGDVMAAIAGSVLATAVELLIARRYQRLTIRGPGGISARNMLNVAAPLLIFGIALQLHARIDLFAIAALGGSALDAGLYAAAQNLAVPPSLFALAFSPLLLATLGRHTRAGEQAQATALAQGALRLTSALLPFTVVIAATAAEIVGLIFGPAFAGSAIVLSMLFASAVAMAFTAVAVSIITVSGEWVAVSLLGVCLLVGAIVGHIVLIPQFGITGAALATMTSATGAAIAGLVLVYRKWHIHSAGTLSRGALMVGPVYWVTSSITTTSWWALMLKLSLATAGVLAAFALLGEFSRDERTWLSSKAVVLLTGRWRSLMTENTPL